MRDLAEDFGISDVGLAKRCRRLGIPVPGRGYWARVDAGQQPHRPKLAQRDPQWFDDGALTVAPSKVQPDVAGSDSEGNQGSKTEASIAQRDETCASVRRPLRGAFCRGRRSRESPGASW